jgi:hypothetical protein
MVAVFFGLAAFLQIVFGLAGFFLVFKFVDL